MKREKYYDLVNRYYWLAIVIVRVVVAVVVYDEICDEMTTTMIL